MYKDGLIPCMSLNSLVAFPYSQYTIMVHFKMPVKQKQFNYS